MPRRTRTILLTISMALLCIAVVSAQTARSPEPARVPVINHASGLNPEGPEPPPPPPPPELSAEAMQGILKSLGTSSGPGSVYVRMTPRNKVIPNRASISFWDVYFVTGKDQYSRWKAPFNEQDKRAGLWVRSEGPGRKYLIDAPWLASFPGLTIMIVVIAANVFGDGLRDVLDPRLNA